MHDPERREIAAASQVAGGKARRQPRARDVLVAELERIAREQAPKILAAYTDALDATKLQAIGFQVVETPDHALRMRAADSVLDRAIGKPGSTLALTGPDGGPITLAAALADDARDTE